MPPPASSSDLLHAALDIALTGFILFRPVYAPADPATVIDLAYEHLNPAAQRMLQQPECPAETFLTLYPNAVEAGIFAFYRDTFLAGEPGHYDVNYQHDGLDNYFRLAARRAGELLVVSFSDTADQPRTAVEEALRQSQVREQRARAEAEQERALLRAVLTQAPVGFALFQGDDHVVTLANDPVCAMWGYAPAQVLGHPLLEGVPELRGQGFTELLSEAARSGIPFVGTEVPAELRQPHGTTETHYFNFVYQPVYDAAGGLLGVFDVVIDVTAQVTARRELEQLNQELEQLNQELEQLNQELEARVAERTREAEAARAAAEAAAQRLRRLTDSLPSTTFLADEYGNTHYISPQWYAYTGMAPGAPITEAWPGLIHPDDLPAVAREYGAALAAGRGWSYEFRLRRADGQYRWFASQGVPEPLDEARAAGRPRQWFGSNLDIHALKQAQHEVQERDRRLNEILRQSPAMLATLEGPEHRYTFTNPGYDALVSHRARLGATVAECLPEVVAQGFIDLLDGVYRTGQPHEGRETRVVFAPPAGGEPLEYYVDFTYQALRDAQGQPTGVLVFIVDVTERVRARQQAEAAQAQLLAAAEQAAAEREAFYQVYTQTPALVAMLRAPEHRFAFVNPAYQALFPGRQLVGLDVAVAVPELPEQGFVALLDRVYQTGETYFGADVPFAVVPAPGQPARVAYYNFTYQAYREHGAIAGISIFAFDVTEQVRARQQRETQRRELQQLFLQAPAPIVVLDGPTLVYQLVNPAYQQIFPGRTLLNKPLVEALPELIGTPIPDLLRRVYDTGEPYTAQELPLRMARHEGAPPEDIYWTFTYQARRDAQGAVDGVHVFAHDVTGTVRDRQQAQALTQELTAANEQLRRTNVDLDTFVYTASHDLKAPISNLDGLLTLLHEELPAEVAASDHVAPALAHMRHAVERFQRTIEHLTEVAKLQKEHTPTATAVDLAAVVEDVRQDLLPQLRATHARLTVAVANFPSIFFSEKNLRSVVYNLLSNALKYCHPDRRPHIDVRAHVRAGHTVLEVHDNGLGLEPGQVDRLFGLFQRFHTHVEGTGIGLYMIKRLVENAGGRIEVHSQPGAGTTFFVHLPHAPGVPAD